MKIVGLGFVVVTLLLQPIDAGSADKATTTNAAVSVRGDILGSLSTTGEAVFEVGGQQWTIRASEIDIYGPRGRTIRGIDEDGNIVEVRTITARNFVGRVEGKAESTVVLTIDPAYGLVVGTLTVDGQRYVVDVRTAIGREATGRFTGALAESSPVDAQYGYVHALPDLYFASYFGALPNGGHEAVISNAFLQGANPAGPWAEHGVTLYLQVWDWEEYSSGANSCGEALSNTDPIINAIIADPEYGPEQGDMFYQAYIRNGEIDDCIGLSATVENNWWDPCWCNAADQSSILRLGSVSARSLVNAIPSAGYNPLDPA